MAFSDIYLRKTPSISFEFFPPRHHEQIEDSKKVIASLSELQPSYMTVTYGAGGGTRGLTKELTGFIAGELKVPAVAHLTCVGHSSADIDSVLDELASVGINHILALRGDPPKGQKEFTAHENGFSCARDLAAHIKKRNDFSIAVAGYPEVHPDASSPDSDIAYLKEKIDAGAQIVITQLFFDPEVYFSFKDRCVAAGINAPIVPGIMPIRNVSQVKRFTDLCGASIPEDILKNLDKLQNSPESVIEYGSELASNISRKLLKGGAPGIHFYTLNKGKQIVDVVHSISDLLKN